MSDLKDFDEDVSLWEIESSLEDDDVDINFDYYYNQSDDRDDYRWGEMSYNIPEITGWESRFSDYEDQTPF